MLLLLLCLSRFPITLNLLHVVYHLVFPFMLPFSLPGEGFEWSGNLPEREKGNEVEMFGSLLKITLGV